MRDCLELGSYTGRIGEGVLVFVGVVAVMGLLFVRLPSAFLPDEDQGRLMAMVTLPSGATLEQTEKVMRKVNDQFLKNEKDAVDSVLTITGFNFGGQGQNNGIAFVNLKDWSERPSKEHKAQAVAARAQKAFGSMKEAKSHGVYRLEGKTYVVQDGDIMHIL